MSVILQLTEQTGLESRPEGYARGPHCVAAETNDEPRSDSAALAAAFRADDGSAAHVLAEHLLPLVTRLVRRLTSWSGDCEDLVQDVLVTALSKRKSFHAHAKLETWITRITINRCRTHQRKQWVRTKLFRAWAERGNSATAATSPHDLAVADERAAAVRAAVAQLPSQSREAIVLCYLEGMTVAEAAEALVLRRGTLEVRLSRARNQLREALAGKLGESAIVERANARDAK